MIKPNFEAMSRQELLAYIRKNRDDDEAFRIYMDRVTAKPATEWYPAPQSIDDLKHFPELLEKHRARREEDL